MPGSDLPIGKFSCSSFADRCARSLDCPSASLVVAMSSGVGCGVSGCTGARTQLPGFGFVKALADFRSLRAIAVLLLFMMSGLTSFQFCYPDTYEAVAGGLVCLSLAALLEMSLDPPVSSSGPFASTLQHANHVLSTCPRKVFKMVLPVRIVGMLLIILMVPSTDAVCIHCKDTIVGCTGGANCPTVADVSTNSDIFTNMALGSTPKVSGLLPAEVSAHFTRPVCDAIVGSHIC